VILVAVGTFVHGFDELVAAADEVSARLGLSGFAQIGHSRVIPRHLEWERFLAPPVLAQHLAASRLVICHGGIGLLGEAMRAGRPIVAVPRRGRPTKSNPAGDQAGLVCRLAEIHPIRCALIRSSCRRSWKPASPPAWHRCPTGWTTTFPHSSPRSWPARSGLAVVHGRAEAGSRVSTQWTS
jgi:UDP-N-acetylglucosamine transferase subunit ALG13